jgi:NADPH:quinone reductase-like Zn-dependent oxidoreductase
MKAIIRRRWGTPRDVVELADIPKPEPADDEVLVRVLASSINRGDYYALGGVGVLMRPMIGGFLRPKDERIGGDFAGIAEAVGKNVTDIEPGDEVYGARSGALAEYVSAKMAVARKPANLSFEEASAVPVGALTALAALRDQGKLESGQRVLVNGASGSVGIYAVQLAKALGGNRSWRENRRVLDPHGKRVLVGMPKGSKLAGPLPRLARFMVARQFSKDRQFFFVCKPNRADLAFVRELIEAGKVRPVVDRVYPLAEAVAALETMGEGHVQGKLVVRVAT